MGCSKMLTVLDEPSWVVGFLLNASLDAWPPVSHRAHLAANIADNLDLGKIEDGYGHRDYSSQVMARLPSLRLHHGDVCEPQAGDSDP